MWGILSPVVHCKTNVTLGQTDYFLSGVICHMYDALLDLAESPDALLDLAESAVIFVTLSLI